MDATRKGSFLRPVRNVPCLTRPASRVFAASEGKRTGAEAIRAWQVSSGEAQSIHMPEEVRFDYSAGERVARKLLSHQGIGLWLWFLRLLGKSIRN